MFSYVDTSLVLSILFEEDTMEESISLLDNSKSKFSSTIAECYNNLNKVKVCNVSQKMEIWYSTKVKELEKILSLLNFKVYDKDIVNLIKTNINLIGCKTLDSIHLATAMYIKMKTDSEIKILSYDKKMNKVGKKIGLETIISEDKLL